ncbi:MAG: winged helix-turn-helix domain-containing protein [Bacteriovoracaceae bacterium]|nr:winged helix-turn-helix domain-containing protein [Bacteriovoracaceae bacterium]
MKPNEITPIMRKILKKLYTAPAGASDAGQLGLSLSLNDLTITKSLRKLWEHGYIKRDPIGNYSLSPSHKDVILELLKNKKRNKYEIHKILGDCVEFASENSSSESLDFYELKLSNLNAKILESKMKELKEFIQKLQMHGDTKNHDTKTYFVYRGMIEEKILRQQVDEMYLGPA